MTEPRTEPESSDPYAYLKERPTKPGSTSYLPSAPEGDGDGGEQPEPHDSAPFATIQQPPISPPPISPPPLAPPPTTPPIPSQAPPPSPENGEVVEPAVTHTDDELGLTGEMKGMTRRELRAARVRREAELATGAVPIVASPSPEPSAPDLASPERPAPPAVGQLPVPPTTPPPVGPPAGLANPPGAIDPTDTADISPWQQQPGSQPGSEPPKRGMSTVVKIAIGLVVLVLVGVGGWAIIRLATADDSGEQSVAAPTATSTATGTDETPLQAMLPDSVEGGVNTEDPGPSGITYSLASPGWVEDPNMPEAALESYAGIFQGGAEPVTLTASRFGSVADADAHAQALAATGGTAVDEGVVYPTEQRGYYWIFNNDGLVMIVWTDGELGAYSVVAEDSESALDFYHGLDF